MIVRPVPSTINSNHLTTQPHAKVTLIQVEKDLLLERISKIQWCHSIDLGNGVTTPGLSKTKPLTDHELPDLEGKSVLDIGAWDGLNAFLAEKKGASRVVALDHYAWGVDMFARNRYWQESKEQGKFPDYRLDETTFWNDALPGKAGFELAHEALSSKVESVLGDFMKIDPNQVGMFDVVLFLGVLYHLREPLTALERVRALTKGVAVIETSAISVPGAEDSGLLRFYAADELDGDYGNYFGASASALAGMARAAGFSRTEIKVGPPPQPRRRFGAPECKPLVYRLVMHAYV